MRAFSTVFLVAVTLSATPASGTPLEVRNGQRIRISLAGHQQAALALPPGSQGWRLDLARARGTLRLSDVTVGAAPSTMELQVAGKGVVLDTNRFRPDHAYRIELRQGMTVIGAAFIYLKPPAKKRGPIRFTDGEASALADGEMAVVFKGTF